MNTRYLRLCLVTNLKTKSFEEYSSFVVAALRGGVTSVQLRVKNESDANLFQLALQFKDLLHSFRVPLIINDHVELAKAIDADGVHIGQTDKCPKETREILGPDKIIGLSIESLEQLEIANQLSCIDYVAASAFLPSKTKPDCKMFWRTPGLQQFVQLSKHPVTTIGGITEQNIQQVMACGVEGVAVIGAIHDHLQPEIAARDLITKQELFYAERDQSHSSSTQRRKTFST